MAWAKQTDEPLARRMKSKVMDHEKDVSDHEMDVMDHEMDVMNHKKASAKTKTQWRSLIRKCKIKT